MKRTTEQRENIISYDEQTERLQARMQDKNKAWKTSASDWSERKYWDDYQKAYEDALTQCNEIPWHIVPANHSASEGVS